jgi:hypothetical protein
MQPIRPQAPLVSGSSFMAPTKRGLALPIRSEVSPRFVRRCWKVELQRENRVYGGPRQSRGCPAGSVTCRAAAP